MVLDPQTLRHNKILPDNHHNLPILHFLFDSKKNRPNMERMCSTWCLEEIAFNKKR